MTKEELAELKYVVRRAIEEERELYNEHWLTGEQLCEQFGMFTPSWLKTYGHTLHRKQAIVYDQKGDAHKTGWAYPRNLIQRMIQSGEIKSLRMKEPESTAAYGGMLVG